MKALKSECHRAPVTAKGMPDFLRSKKVATFYYVCTTCKEPCDVIEVEEDDE